MIWIGAGIVGFVWPHITIFISAVIIGWAFLVLGIFDIIDSRPAPPPALLVDVPDPGRHRRGHRLPVHPPPGAPLTALVVLIGILAIVFGAVEIVGAFSARHADEDWEAYKAQLR